MPLLCHSTAQWARAAAGDGLWVLCCDVGEDGNYLTGQGSTVQAGTPVGRISSLCIIAFPSSACFTCCLAARLHTEISCNFV